MKFNLALIAFYTIVIRESKRTFRVWRQSFLPSIITSILYFVIFGRVIGHRVGTMNGIPYLQFIAPGLIMMQIITSAYSSSVSAFFIAKFQRQIQELLVSPMPAYVILFGFIVSAIIRGVLVGILITIIALFFTHLRIHSWLIMLTVVFFASFLFAIAGLVNGVYAKNFDDITIIPTFVLAPLTYLGGVFYSIHLLPPFWQIISLINPITYMINAFRYGFLGFADASILIAFAIIFSLIIILFIFANYLINSGKGLRE
ncbi:MAG: ABC transporter permease [Proteobacteria bacterium]|nr:ABC transporter permease [Pseudomonadota bacterium]